MYLQGQIPLGFRAEGSDEGGQASTGFGVEGGIL